MLKTINDVTTPYQTVGGRSLSDLEPSYKQQSSVIVRTAQGASAMIRKASELRSAKPNDDFFSIPRTRRSQFFSFSRLRDFIMGVLTVSNFSWSLEMLASFCKL